MTSARAGGPREGLLVLLLLELGLRISEAVGANIEDLGEQGRHRVLHILGKGQATKAPPSRSTRPSATLSTAPPRAARIALLITGTGARLTRQHAGKLIRRLGEQMGLPHLHPHQLRHAFVTLSLDEGASLAMSRTLRATPILARRVAMTAIETA